MLVLRNTDSGNFFLVDNFKRKIEVVHGQGYTMLARFSHIFGELQILDFKGIESIKQFRKILSKDEILPTIPYPDTYSYISSTYPEYFI